MELKPSKSYLDAITSHIHDFHWRRIGRISSEALHQLVVEQKKACPDKARIDALKDVIHQAHKHRGDVSVTIRDVINPMRAELGMEPIAEDSFGPKRQQDNH